MTDMRDKIAAVQYFGTTIGHGAADAIIAALPRMVPDLVWDDSGRSLSGGYRIARMRHDADQPYTVHIPAHFVGPMTATHSWAGSLKEATDMANAHNRAEVCKALGLS